jgi:hypothetical protein
LKVNIVLKSLMNFLVFQAVIFSCIRIRNVLLYCCSNFFMVTF